MQHQECLKSFCLGSSLYCRWRVTGKVSSALNRKNYPMTVNSLSWFAAFQKLINSEALSLVWSWNIKHLYPAKVLGFMSSGLPSAAADKGRCWGSAEAACLVVRFGSSERKSLPFRAGGSCSLLIKLRAALASLERRLVGHLCEFMTYWVCVCVLACFFFFFCWLEALSRGRRLMDGHASPGCSAAATDWPSGNLASATAHGAGTFLTDDRRNIPEKGEVEE